MPDSSRLSGHLAAFFTIFFWGTTFVFTKSLLASLSPVEILFCRFALGYLALLAIRPRRLKPEQPREEFLFAAAGLCGVTLYFLFENVALTFTLASNVGVIVAVSPLFTALLAPRFLDGERPGARFFAGFAAAIAGVALVSWGGGGVALDLRGSLLALLDAPRQVGLCASASHILTPRKSVTAILGVADHPIQASVRSCLGCPAHDGCQYRKSGGHCGIS